ncbi:hypothetical protein MATL_G00144310 [Megalops atlanticus]|uniref:Cadherin domain-containing protein n=1 Tax=Megalops atlanticus TaxID=7932 RepID=A0A9D3T9R9_MEGAT|nr:hypothetical protein MATL_G00144310 [Megalops atlanticus]
MLISMGRFRSSVFCPILVQIQVLIASCEYSSCQSGFTSDHFTFKVDRTHLQKGRVLGKVSFSDCGGRQRAPFLSEDSRFKVDPDGTVSVKRPVTLHDGHKSFMLHAWDSKGKKNTVTVTVVHEPRQSHHHHHSETDSATQEQAEPTPAVPVLMFPQSSEGLRRKRDWVIPPINFPENDRGPFPKKMVQIRSSNDKEIKIQYSISGPGANQPPVGLFTIDRNSGGLYVTQPLDRETTDKYKLFAHASSSHGQAEEPMEIIIFVIDQNDNKPEFTQDPFLGFIPEVSRTGFEFMRVTAIDKDEPGNLNSDVRYAILSQEPQKPQPNMFTINPVTGGIRLNSDGLDREKYPKYTLVIQAADMEGNGLINTCTAIVTVTDRMAPQFEKTSYTVSVPENKVGALVAKMKITAGDEPYTPTYRIISGNHQGFFRISTGSRKMEGIITTAKSLDFERKKEYTLLVTMESDRFEPTPNVSVIVTVEDVNEAPVFDPAELVVVKPEGLTSDSDLILYTATDPDSERKQTVGYKVGSDPAGWLSVGKESGLIKVKSPLVRESPFVKDGRYEALILAIDNDEAPRTGTGTLVVELQDARTD